MMAFSRVRDLLTDDELAALEKAPLIAGSRHPTWYPIFYETPRTVEHLTNQSVALISKCGETEWLRALQPRLTRLEDREGAAAALAELRAYGGFLHAGFTVTPIPRSNLATPDFNIDAGDGQVVVEVFTKLQDEDQTQLLSDLDAGKTPHGVERSIIRGRHTIIQTTISELQPGGAPDPEKPYDSVQANLISRVCGAKGNETQLPDSTSALLWIDFRSFGSWPEGLTLEQVAPLISGRDGLTSGALWYAFYGWRGAPIFEEDFFPRDRVVPMGHDGRFRITGTKKSKLSGVILVLSDGLILFENPWVTRPLPDRARHFSERLPWFNLGGSICNWSPGDALVLAELGRRQIEVMRHWREALGTD